MTSPPEPCETTDPRGRDDLEPPAVPAGRLLAVAAGVFLMGFLAAAVMGGAYHWRVTRSPTAVASTFPAPRLETNQTPSATLSVSHGPGPYRERAPQVRAGENHAPETALQAAMLAEAARGPSAYDPVAGTGS